jgi:CHAD domain-containing protein
VSARPEPIGVPELSVGEPDRRSTAVHALRWALAEAFQRLVRHEPGVRSGEDPEDVHQARVATRRFRVILRQFRDVSDRTWSDDIRSDVKVLAARLGAVRDADVLLDRLRTSVEQLAEQDRSHGHMLLDGLSQTRKSARDRLMRTLLSPGHQQLLDKMHEAVRTPRLSSDAEAKAIDVLVPLAMRAWRRVRTTVEDLGPQPTDRDLHRLRIATKRARYAVNVVAPSVGKRADRFTKAAAGLQDVLGDHQDAVVAQAWLRRRAAEGPALDAFVAGQLIAREQAAVARARAAWPRAWRKLQRPKTSDWVR